jgi:hypothetical protein
MLEKQRLGGREVFNRCAVVEKILSSKRGEQMLNSHVGSDYIVAEPNHSTPRNGSGRRVSKVVDFENDAYILRK